MSEVGCASLLQANGELPFSIVSLNGDVLFENAAARQLFNHGTAPTNSVLSVLSSPTSWNDLVQDLSAAKTIVDRPLLVQTPHSDTDLCYVTAFLQWNEEHQPDALLCVWAARRNALSLAAAAQESCDDYVHSLEALIEHRTYQQLLSAEWNELAHEVLDALPSGILLAFPDGRVAYRNRAVMDTFGLHLGDYPEPNVRYFFSSELRRIFQSAVQEGRRGHGLDKDPGGQPAHVEMLPIFRQSHVYRIAVQYDRPWTEVPA